MGYQYYNMLIIQSSLYMDHNLEQAHNTKTILCVFEQLSGLKINFHKSEIFCFGEAKNYESQYIQLFGCNTWSFPIRYLGIPIHYRKLSNCDWMKIQERFEKRLSSWKGKNLSTGGRLTLINFVLSSLPMYMMFFFEIPKGFEKSWIIFDLDFFGKVTSIKESIG